MTSQGSAYGRLSRAFRTGNLVLAEQSVHDLSGPLSLADALSFVLLLRDQPERYERAAARWVARFANECDRVRLYEVELAAAALRNALAPAHSLPALASLESLLASRRIRFTAPDSSLRHR